jgi:phenylalanine-4-hydroxylase
MSARSKTGAASAQQENVLFEFRSHLTPQRHTDYTEDDEAVWREVLRRNEWLLERYASRIPPAYVTGLASLDLPGHLPRVEEINERLASTGWRTVCVDGYIPSAAYVGLMSRSIFPISRNIRRPEHVDYAPAPDLVHDILGHLPLLFSPEHRDFLRRLATVMSSAMPCELDDELYEGNRHLSELKSSPTSLPTQVAAAEERVLHVQRLLRREASELTQLARMYLWSIEFGLLGAVDSFQVYGAAFLSSPTEFSFVCDRADSFLPYSLDVVGHDIEFSDLQKGYFVATDFGHWHDVLLEYEGTMPSRNAGRRGSGIRELAARAPEWNDDDA